MRRLLFPAAPAAIRTSFEHFIGLPRFPFAPLTLDVGQTVAFCRLSFSIRHPNRCHRRIADGNRRKRNPAR